MQYNRRESIEIAGIPETVTDECLEETTLGILEAIGVPKIEPYQVHACHRLKKRNNTIIKFTSRKFADAALHYRSKLKNIRKTSFGFAEGTKLFINESLCRPYQFLNYKVRQAAKVKKIFSYNLWKGKLTIKINETDRPIIISHINDLIEYELAAQSDIDLFYKNF